jgi:GAF domain-containing protein
MQRGAFSDDEVRLVELLAPRLATALAMASLAEQNAEQPIKGAALTLVKRAGA